MLFLYTDMLTVTSQSVFSCKCSLISANANAANNEFIVASYIFFQKLMVFLELSRSAQWKSHVIQSIRLT